MCWGVPETGIVNLAVSNVHSDLFLVFTLKWISLQAGASRSSQNSAAQGQAGSLRGSEDISKQYKSTTVRKFASGVYPSLSDGGWRAERSPVSPHRSIPSGLLLPEQDKKLLDTKDPRQKGNMFQTWKETV